MRQSVVARYVHMADSKILRALLHRAGCVAFCNADEVRVVSEALLQLAPLLPVTSLPSLVLAFQKYARKDTRLFVNICSSFLHTNDDSARHAPHQLALLSNSLPVSCGVEGLWDDVMHAVALPNALFNCSPDVMRWIVKGMARRATFDETFLSALDDYIAGRLNDATPASLSSLLGILAMLPGKCNLGLRSVNLIAGRAAAVMKSLDVGQVGLVCWLLQRFHCTDDTLALAVQARADSLVEKGDFFSLLYCLAFIASHKSTTISAEVVQLFVKRIAQEDVMDRSSIVVLCEALYCLPLAVKGNIRHDLGTALSSVASQLQQLCSIAYREGGLNSCREGAQGEICRLTYLLLTLGETTWGRSAASTEANDHLAAEYPVIFTDALLSCVRLVTTSAEEWVANADQTTWQLLTAMLGTPVAKVRTAALEVLGECARQHVHIGTLDTFRIILLLGDYGVVDELVYTYVLRELASTMDAIPASHLCAALRCIVRLRSCHECTTTPCSEVLHAELDSFGRVCTEKVLQYVGEGLTLRYALELMARMHELQYNKSNDVRTIAAYMNMKVVQRGTVAADYCRATAALVRSALDDDAFKSLASLHDFLQAVMTTSTRDDTSLSPSQWLMLYDGATVVTPITAEQQNCTRIVDEMAATPSTDRDTLRKLVTQYVEGMHHISADSYTYFFATCADKLVKEDKLLKQCVASLSARGVIEHLSASTIASILDSLAKLRFVYSDVVKKTLMSMTEEQWCTMDAVPLKQIICALAKLSIRPPTIMAKVVMRLAEVYCFLTVRDTVQVVHALQVLGCHDGQLLERLLHRTAMLAQQLDEVSISVLFSAPGVQRLLHDTKSALPLLQRACNTLTSPQQRSKVARQIGRSQLPRELILNAQKTLASTYALNDTMMTRQPRIEM